MTRLPSASDFNIHNSLDEIRACEHFLGKTIAEAERLLAEAPHYYDEDFIHMGPKAFDFYMQAAINCVKVATDDDVIRAMRAAISTRFEINDLTLGTERVLEMINYIVEHFDQFGPDAQDTFFLDLKAAYVQLGERIRAQSSVLS